MTKQFTFVKTKNDKSFITPKRFAKGGSYGYIVDILTSNSKTLYLVELDDGIFEYTESELEVVESGSK